MMERASQWNHPRLTAATMVMRIFIFCLLILPRQQHQVASLSLSFLERVSPRRLLNLLRPSSTNHLADLLELYDVVQDPAFLASSEKWKLTFRSIIDGVEVTSRGVAEGQGLIARRDFSAGEVVALYPIHALGYSDGKSPPQKHDRSERVYCAPATKKTKKNSIIGTSDLVYFEEESHIFGDAQDDFSFAMTDPSGKYVFDVNPGRSASRNQTRGVSIYIESSAEEGEAAKDKDLFVAHYVNDASFADFSSIVNAAKELMQQQSQSIENDYDCDQNTDVNDNEDIARRGMELDTAAARLAIDYLEASTGTRKNLNAPATEAANATTTVTGLTGFNVVMCGFGPPPLMGYLTTRPVRCGEELLASYGLGYWLGKAFPDDDDAVLDASLAALDARPEVRNAQTRADEAIEAALEVGDRAVRKTYKAHTQLIQDTFDGFRSVRKMQNRKQKQQWWRR